jgi:hypothetical protein
MKKLGDIFLSLIGLLIILSLLIQYPLQLLLGIVLIIMLMGANGTHTKTGWCRSCHGAVEYKVQSFGNSGNMNITCPICGGTDTVHRDYKIFDPNEFNFSIKGKKRKKKEKEKEKRTRAFMWDDKKREWQDKDR